jgi:hypothetical protein
MKEFIVKRKGKNGTPNKGECHHIFKPPNQLTNKPLQGPSWCHLTILLFALSFVLGVG